MPIHRENIRRGISMSELRQVYDPIVHVRMRS